MENYPKYLFNNGSEIFLTNMVTDLIEEPSITRNANQVPDDLCACLPAGNSMIYCDSLVGFL